MSLNFKSVLALTAALAAGVLASCRAEAGIDAPAEPSSLTGVRTFVCTLGDEGASRVSVSEQGKARWEPGDQILVHGKWAGGKYSSTVTLTASDISADGKSATITAGSYEAGTAQDSGGVSDVYAIYPAEAAAVDNGKTNWRSVAKWSESNLPLMLGYNTATGGSKLVFRNVCGIISFRVSGEYDSYEFSGNAGETVGYEGLESQLYMKTGGEYSDWVHAGSPVQQVSGPVTPDGSTLNYVCIPGGASLESGFTIRLKKDGSIVKVAKSTASAIVPRSSLLPLGDITSRLRDPSSQEAHQSAIDLSGATDLGADGTANCYIITRPGDYKFKAVKGNGSTSVGTVAGATIVWETLCNDETVTPNSIVAAVDYEGSWMCLRTPGTLKPGNALVAATDESGTILWSWHVWIPSTAIESNTYSLSQCLVMDRNLGALVAAGTGSGDPRSFGLLYQWGRKDPFPGCRSASDSKVATVAGTATSVQASTITLAQSVAQPTLLAATQNAEWNSSSDDDLWGKTSKAKSVYDPCPPGWKVPARSEASPLFTDLSGVSGWNAPAGSPWFQVGSPVTTFPYTGYIDDYITTAGSYSYPGSRTAIWSADGSGVKAYAQDVRYSGGSTTSALKSTAKARGAAVRCVSVDYAPFENEAGMPVMGSYTRTDFSSSQMAELSGLCFSSDGSFMWGVGDGGTLYKIGFDMSVSTQYYADTDMEGVTIDPSSGDLYICTEPQKVKKVPSPGYNSISTLFLVEEAADYGNSGLEGITYYKDGVIYTGAQTGATLWAYRLDGTKLWKKQLGTIAPGIMEVGDLYYDAATDLLWVSDSEAFKLFVFDGAVTKLKAVYDISFIGNPESVLVDHVRSCVWVGDDRGSSSRIYKIAFTGLDDNLVAQSSTLCSEEYLGAKPAVIAYLTEYTSASSLDASCVTHINYAHGRFGNPSTGDGGIVIAEPSLLRKVLALKSSKPSLKVLLMIGGWGEKADGFSMMARDPDKRTAFCRACLEHVENYSLDGIDIDWEYPGGGPSSNGKSDSDASNFNLLLKELRETLGTTRIISFASSSSAGYVDWKEAIKYIDYVNVMTYDMGKPPYHNSTLYRSSLTSSRSCEESVEAHRKAGVPLDRMVLGVPFYGHGTSPYDEDVTFNEMSAILSGGTYSGKNIRRWDDTAKVPCLVDGSGTMLLGYDDAESVACKGAFALSKGLRGVMFWEFRHDDASGTLRTALYNSIYQ